MAHDSIKNVIQIVAISIKQGIEVAEADCLLGEASRFKMKKEIKTIEGSHMQMSDKGATFEIWIIIN